MFAKMIISLMMIGLLLGCNQNQDTPPEENQPVEENIQEDMDDVGEEAEDMFEEDDMNRDEMNEDETDPNMDDTEEPTDREEE